MRCVTKPQMLNLIRLFASSLAIMVASANASNLESCEQALQAWGLSEATLVKLSPNSTAHQFKPRPAQALAPIAPQQSLAEVWEELNQKGHRLFEHPVNNPDRGFIVFMATGAKIPKTMYELGRLREDTFRRVGEGTGKPLDIDSFDPYYIHLICWDKSAKAIAGAYRIGRLDEILAQRGLEAMYSFSLFDFSEYLNSEWSQGTLEMGRSFVAWEYQRGPALGYLWKAIGVYLAENPQYKYLVGPVSISGNFHDDSKFLITQHLMRTFGHPQANNARPRTPPEFATLLNEHEVTEILGKIDSLTDLQHVVRYIEGDPDLRLPPLIKLYLGLNVRFLAFNWDADFNTIDGMIWTDITKLPFETIEKYMGTEKAKAYLKRHGISAE